MEVRVTIYLKRTIIPPVNSKIVAYVIHKLTDTLIKAPILILKTTNQITKKVGLVVNKQEIIPRLIKNKNLNIKMV